MKLTKRLKEILMMMGEWKLKKGVDGDWWLQKGLSVECIWIHGRARVHILLNEGLIAEDEDSKFPIYKYHLTSKGKERINK